jgi:hypothetical protein
MHMHGALTVCESLNPTPTPTPTPTPNQAAVNRAINALVRRGDYQESSQGRDPNPTPTPTPTPTPYPYP